MSEKCSWSKRGGKDEEIRGGKECGSKPCMDEGGRKEGSEGDENMDLGRPGEQFISRRRARTEERREEMVNTNYSRELTGKELVKGKGEEGKSGMERKSGLKEER